MEDVEPPAAQATLPPPQPGQPNDNTRALIDPGTGEPIELYTGQLITAESGGGDQFVHLGWRAGGFSSTSRTHARFKPELAAADVLFFSGRLTRD